MQSQAERDGLRDLCFDRRAKEEGVVQLHITRRYVERELNLVCEALGEVDVRRHVLAEQVLSPFPVHGCSKKALLHTEAHLFSGILLRLPEVRAG